jgi:hypothetical protein
MRNQLRATEREVIERGKRRWQHHEIERAAQAGTTAEIFSPETLRRFPR